MKCHIRNLPNLKKFVMMLVNTSSAWSTKLHTNIHKLICKNIYSAITFRKIRCITAEFLCEYILSDYMILVHRYKRGEITWIEG